jgi:diadenosine tetraphosphate (Ap4A) HIT family hydrolase
MGSHWTVNVAEDATSRPWVVFQSKRHVPSICDLTSAERSELIDGITRITETFEEFRTVRRVHVQLLNEISPPHVHFHISTSHDGDEGAAGPETLTAPLGPNDYAPAQAEWLYHVSPPADALNAEKSKLVRLMVTLLGNARTALGFRWLYARFDNWRPHSRDGWDGGELYVLLWTAVLVLFAMAATLFPDRWLTTIALMVASYRVLDLLTYQLLEFLDRHENQKKSFERTFVLTSINLLNIFLWVFTASLAIASPEVDGIEETGLSERLWASFAVVTLRGEAFGGGDYLWVDVLGTAATSFLLLIVISSIIGLLGNRLTESAADEEQS